MRHSERRSHRVAFLLVAFCLLAGLEARPAVAQVGTPDASFGPGTCGGGRTGFSPTAYGWLTCADAEPSQQDSFGRGVGIQFDNGTNYNIVVAGWEHHNPVGPTPQDIFAVSRFDDTGNLDLAFGGGDGKVTTAFTAPARAFDLLVRPDESLIAVGGDSFKMVMAAYTPAGVLDAGFGLGGLSSSTLGSTEGARGVAMLGGAAADDFVLVGTDSTAGLDAIVIERFDQLGNSTGAAIFDNAQLGTVGLNFRAFDVFVDLGTQSIYVAGEAENPATGAMEFLVAKLDFGLTPDSGFGGTSALVRAGGFQTIGFGGLTRAGARGVEVAIDGNDHLYLGGSAQSGGLTNFAVAKLDKSTGALAAMATGGPADSRGYEITIDSRNRIVVVGAADATAPQTPQFALMRFDEHLVPDATFGSSGLGWERTAATSGPSRAFDVVVRKKIDGALLLAGDSVLDPGSIPPYVTNWLQTPARFEGGPVCGNGVLDAGENCESPFQACCSNWCTFEPATTLCRASVDQCDAAEYCAGASDLCPADLPVADGTACDDGLFCNGTDSCLAGACSTHAGDPCAGPDGDGDCSETCDETADNCLASDADGSACSDGIFCNGADTCLAGACAVHAGDPCAGPDGDGDCNETCDEADDDCGAPDPDGSACTDGLFCTGVDTCAAGVCTGAGDPCAGADGDGDCAETCDEGADNCLGDDPDGSACTDGLFCNGADTCVAGSCSAHAGDPCAGADGDGDCSETCDEGADNCLAADPDGSACTDGLFCNGTDTCLGGSCSTHTGDPCTGADGDGDCLESCDEGADNCLAADPDGSVCDDGLFCTGTDTCASGACTGAGDPCSGPDADDDCAESCDEAADNCLGNDPAGSACLDDGDACTDDECDGSGTCTHPVVAGVDSDGDGDDDNDDDGIYDLCDNCINTCNPAQEDSDGDGDRYGGDICDTCPASDQDTEDPGCATAAYNSTLDCCSNTAAAAVAVDAAGESAICGGSAGDVILDSHDGMSSMQIPAGAVSDEETISIQENTKGGREYFLQGGSGQVIQSLDLSPDGISFVTPVVLCMNWVDANDNGFLDRPPYTALINERSIHPHYYDESAMTTVALADSCKNVPCTTLDADGFPTDWGGNNRYDLAGTAEDESLLNACCDKDENTFCWETSTFSSYGLLAPDSLPVLKTRIIVKRLDAGDGEQKLTFKGTLEAEYPFDPALRPDENGLRFVIEDSEGSALLDVDLPGGAYDPVTREGWQLRPSSLDLTDPPGVYKFMFRSRSGPAGITKVLVKVKRPATTGTATITLLVKGKDMTIPAEASDLPLQAAIDFTPAVFSGQRFLTAFEAIDCAMAGGDKSAKCK